MRVVVALDSFKGSLRARGACAAAARGLLAAVPDVDVVTVPMADGGEGTVEALADATGAEWIPCDVTGPLPGTNVRAGIGWLESHGPAALVEMASASGLELLAPDELDPMRTTTYGTGELLAAARDRGARKVWLAIGGSATVDGGTGAARALGWRFLDGAGAEIALGGGRLQHIARLVPPPEPPAELAVEVLCDVDNPLLGPRGAARVFGPQKGATPEMVELLEAGLAHLAAAIQRDLGVDVRELPGGGAAGGFGAGASAFLGATLVPGVEAVMDVVELDAALAQAEWVITGEGRLDEQSLHGKVLSGVARRARRAGARIAVLAGSIVLDEDAAAAAGVEAMEAASTSGMPLADALARGAELVERAAERLGRRLVS